MLLWCLGIFLTLVALALAGRYAEKNLQPEVCACDHYGMRCGCWHNGGVDHDGIWKCRDCQRAWYKSYLGGGSDWIEADPEMEEYLRESSEEYRERFKRYPND